ncbi:hypothetical protein Cal6303_4626 [Calothrix sp. PCC 6303]|nr:hypothetical protein Cal6303_4626 [Calothrix sp. PCC 6303]
MGFLDAIFLTLVNTVACIALPRLLSFLLLLKNRITNSAIISVKRQQSQLQSTSFPYCTTQSLTGTPSCQFSPGFCGKCFPKLN